MKLNEYDKYQIIETNKYIAQTIINRLYASFDKIEEEADEVSRQAYEANSAHFNPDTMDPSDIYESASHRGVEHFLIHDQMRQEFLNSSITWLYHQFEKDCNSVFGAIKGNARKQLLTKLGIDVSNQSLWFKCNKELRLAANTVKHGEGDSCSELQSIRPGLFKKELFNPNKLTHELEVTISHINLYADAISSFWEELYKAVNI